MNDHLTEIREDFTLVVKRADGAEETYVSPDAIEPARQIMTKIDSLAQEVLQWKR